MQHTLYTSGYLDKYCYFHMDTPEFMNNKRVCAQVNRAVVLMNADQVISPLCQGNDLASPLSL